MKSLFRSELSKAVLLIVPLALCLGGSTAAQAGDKNPLFAEAVRPGNWNDHTRQGYLKVYSASDEVPSLATLPTGSYTIEARSESHGYVRVPIFITAGRRTVVDPDREQTVMQKRLAQTKHSPRLADR